jgi:hypothetical protein
MDTKYREMNDGGDEVDFAPDEFQELIPRKRFVREECRRGGCIEVTEYLGC